jgi:drug/metabolite transporter (DMT)-like permease
MECSFTRRDFCAGGREFRRKPLVLGRSISAMTMDFGPPCIALASVFFALQTTAIKWLEAGTIPPIMLLQFRGLVLWLFFLLTTFIAPRCGLLRNGSSVQRTHLLFGHPADRLWLCLRAIIYVTFVMLYWTSLECLPAGDAAALSQPFLFANFYTRCILQEPLRPTFWACVLLHLSGILLITRPHFIFGYTAADAAHAEERAEGLIAGLLAGVVLGMQPLLLHLSQRSSWVAIEHVNHAACAFVAAPALFTTFALVEPAGDSSALRIGVFYSRAWSTAMRPDVLPVLFGAIPLCGFFAFTMQTIGYQVTRSAGMAALVAPLELPLTTLLQALCFGAGSISTMSVAGMLLILTSVVLNSLGDRVVEQRAGTPRARREEEAEEGHPTDAEEKDGGTLDVEQKPLLSTSEGGAGSAAPPDYLVDEQLSGGREFQGEPASQIRPWSATTSSSAARARSWRAH